MRCTNCQSEAVLLYVNKDGSQFNCLVCGPCFVEPAHAVPFAQEPDKTVVEKFTVTITAKETGTYCRCDRCLKTRGEFWTAVIASKLQSYLNESDPFRIFPEKHKVEVR